MSQRHRQALATMTSPHLLYGRIGQFYWGIRPDLGDLLVIRYDTSAAMRSRSAVTMRGNTRAARSR